MLVWKAFEHNVITHSAAHHLMTIANLLAEKGYARVTDVAKTLQITRGSASITLKALKERGYVEEDENKFLRLTERGEMLSHNILSMRTILIRFMQDVLKVDAEQAEIDACKIEHLLSTETGEKLFRLIKFILSGDPKATAFLRAYQSYESTCEGEIEECKICEGECLMTTEPLTIKT